MTRRKFNFVVFVFFNCNIWSWKVQCVKHDSTFHYQLSIRAHGYTLIRKFVIAAATVVMSAIQCGMDMYDVLVQCATHYSSLTSIFLTTREIYDYTSNELTINDSPWTVLKIDSEMKALS